MKTETMPSLLRLATEVFGRSSVNKEDIDVEKAQLDLHVPMLCSRAF
jgi:hypothetical protein